MKINQEELFTFVAEQPRTIGDVANRFDVSEDTARKALKANGKLVGRKKGRMTLWAVAAERSPSKAGHPHRRKTDTRTIKTSAAARLIKIQRYLKASVFNALKLGELKLVDQLMATGWVPEDEEEGGE